MMRVRLPNGTVIEYPDANTCTRHANGYTDLLTKKDGNWVAQVPNDAVIEPGTARARVLPFPEHHCEHALNVLEQDNERRHIPSWILRRLKRVLSSYDARANTWRR